MNLRVFKKNVDVCDCVLSDADKSVTQPHLAMTPQQVKELTDRGIPVSLPAQQFLDSDSDSSSWSVDPVFQRDNDINTAWEKEQLSRSKLIKAHKNDKKRYGE